jgi:anaerobic ribonucleoside-triphosphate reductase activating protein
MDVDELATLINSDIDIEGITLSGGEPLNYPKQLTELLRKIAERLTIVIFSGYMLNEIQRSPLLMSVVKMADLSIVGRYDERLEHPYYGKKFIVSRGRVDVDYFKPKMVVEYSINNRSVTKTGIFRTNN